MRNRAIAAIAVTALTGGCFSTEHKGRDPRKVYMTMEDSMRGYSRGNEFYSEMGFGGGLVDAVQSNPRALAAAETFRDRMIMGFIGTMVGAVCMPAALIYGATRAYDDETNNNGGFDGTYGAIALGCTALMFVGAFTMASAMPYQFDAVNTFNDDVDAQQWTPPAYGPPMQPMQPPPMQPPMQPMQPPMQPQPMGPGAL